VGGKVIVHTLLSDVLTLELCSLLIFINKLPSTIEYPILFIYKTLTGAKILMEPENPLPCLQEPRYRSIF